jgi:hypothetical protein
VFPRSYNTFWDIVKKSKVRFKRVKTPYSCEIHEKAPGYRRRKAEVEDLLASKNAPGEHTTELAELLKELDKLKKKVAKCEIHERMFENQRRFMQEKEKDLLNHPRKANGDTRYIVYEDFVDFYNADGKKILNLVLTVLWCGEDGKLQRKYIDNLNSDHIRAHKDAWRAKFGKFGGNVMYVKRVWEFLLRPNEIRQQLKNETNMSADKKKELLAELDKHVNDHGEEFKGATDILRSGDSGGSFHNRVLMLFESCAFKRYGIKWETHTLCKRHAYSLCDAHGGACKRAFRYASVMGELPKEAVDFVRAIINHSKFGDTRAIAYSHMEMKTKEQEYAALADMDGIKDACEFQYYYIDDEGEKVYTAGFVRFRTVSGDDSAPWKAVYLPLVHEGEESKKVCKKCTQGLQRPVWHEKSAGNCKVNWTQVGDKRVLIPAFRETGGEEMKLEAMKVVDMCEWARLEGMPNLQDAISNTVLDGVRLTVSLSNPELFEELFTQMGLDASAQAIFRTKLEILRMHGWKRPSTKQVVDSKKIKKQKRVDAAAPPQKKKRVRKTKPTALLGESKVEMSPSQTPVENAAQKKKKARNASPTVLLGESKVEMSPSQTAVHDLGAAAEDRSVPSRAESEQIEIVLRRSSRDVRKPMKPGSYAEASDEDEPVKKKVAIESQVTVVLPCEPLNEFQLNRQKKIDARLVEDAPFREDIAAALQSLMGPRDDGDARTNSATLSDESEYCPSESSESSSCSRTTRTVSKNSRDVQMDIADVMCGSDRCIFSRLTPAVSMGQPDSTTIERS